MKEKWNEFDTRMDYKNLIYLNKSKKLNEIRYREKMLIVNLY